MVYPQVGLEIGSAIPYAIHWESNGDSHVGSTTAKMAKSVVSVDRPG